MQAFFDAVCRKVNLTLLRGETVIFRVKKCFAIVFCGIVFMNRLSDKSR